jgi:hypothetical protein
MPSEAKTLAELEAELEKRQTQYYDVHAKYETLLREQASPANVIDLLDNDVPARDYTSEINTTLAKLNALAGLLPGLRKSVNEARAAEKLKAAQNARPQYEVLLVEWFKAAVALAKLQDHLQHYVNTNGSRADIFRVFKLPGLEIHDANALLPSHIRDAVNHGLLDWSASWLEGVRWKQ